VLKSSFECCLLFLNTCCSTYSGRSSAIAHDFFGRTRRKFAKGEVWNWFRKELSECVNLHIRDSLTLAVNRLKRTVPSMDREHVKGTPEKARVAGKVTDDKKLQTEGKFEKAVAGDIKDAVKQSNK
jgi:uncharacterized protein YjbJ (UPF0337 family)